MKRNKFIGKALIKHGNKYDYSLIFDTINIKSNYNIICPKHGEFNQRGDVHLNGGGCSKCSGSNVGNINDFILKSKLIHGDKYNYNNSLYVNAKNKIKILCPIHGEFEQTPTSHLSGHGCPKCGFELMGEKQKIIASGDFILKSKLIHGDKYEYNNLHYISAKNKIKILCPIHGEFKQTPNDHLSNKGCPICGSQNSKNEIEIKEFIEIELNIKTEKDNKILNGKEIDIYIPTHNLGIEFDGLYWHSNIYKDNNYHLNKTNLSEENNTQLLHVFEDEWFYKKDIVKSIIKSKLGIYDQKIFARKCIIKEIESKESTKFLNDNHLQGNVGSKIKLGLYYENVLISLMTFGVKRISMGNKIKTDGEYEMLRFCNKLNTTVIGGASKLLSYFIKNHNPKSILSFADRRYSNGNLYKELGFKQLENTKPNYWYFKKNGLIRYHRFGFRKDVLVKDGFDSSLTEFQIMEERGYLRIYDSGCKKYIFKY